MEETIAHKNFFYYIKRYFFEFLEALVALTILNYFKNGSINTFENMKLASGIGIITLILEEYNPDFSSNIKSGISFSVGTNLVGVS